MFVFVVGMERCGTHSAANIINSAAIKPAHVVHEEEPTWCREAQLVYGQKDFRTPDFKKKIANLRAHHKNNKLVCEANHRLAFFSSSLMREFAPDCKFVFLIRDPIQTIVSRIATWAHYKDFVNMYPPEYVKEIETAVAPQKKQFNDYRLNPPPEYWDRQLGELYAWEWTENYKYARRELHNIPVANRKIMKCEELTTKFGELLDFIGRDYFNVSDEVVRCSKTRSDSVYSDRNVEKDGPLIFARFLMTKSRESIVAKIKNDLRSLPKIDRDLIDMDIAIENYLKTDHNKVRTFL